MPFPLVPVLLGGAAALLLVAASRRSSPSSAPSVPSTTPARAALLEQALGLLGTPYQWGGGRSPGDFGLDCSGLVILASKRAGVPLPPCPLATSDGWWRCLPRVSSPLPGDLALYGSPERAVHVELVLAYDPSTGIAQTLGANGGDRDVLTPEIAQERGAFVRYASTEGRSNFLGFVSNPVDSPAQAEGVSPNLTLLQLDEA